MNWRIPLNEMAVNNHLQPTLEVENNFFQGWFICRVQDFPTSSLYVAGCICIGLEMMCGRVLGPKYIANSPLGRNEHLLPLRQVFLSYPSFLFLPSCVSFLLLLPSSSTDGTRGRPYASALRRRTLLVPTRPIAGAVQECELSTMARPARPCRRAWRTTSIPWRVT